MIPTFKVHLEKASFLLQTWFLSASKGDASPMRRNRCWKITYLLVKDSSHQLYDSKIIIIFSNLKVCDSEAGTVEWLRFKILCSGKITTWRKRHPFWTHIPLFTHWLHYPWKFKICTSKPPMVGYNLWLLKVSNQFGGRWSTIWPFLSPTSNFFGWSVFWGLKLIVLFLFTYWQDKGRITKLPTFG